MGTTSMFISELQSSYRVETIEDEKIYHNTKLLLNVYSKVLWRIGSALEELDDECYDSDKKHLFDLVDSLIDVDTQIDKVRFERRMQSIEESKSLIELIDRAVLKLRTYPDSGERYFQILSKVYFVNTSYKYSEQELLESLNVSRATLYREKHRAITMLGVILWGFVIPDYKSYFDKMRLK